MLKKNEQIWRGVLADRDPKTVYRAIRCYRTAIERRVEIEVLKGTDMLGNEIWEIVSPSSMSHSLVLKLVLSDLYDAQNNLRWEKSEEPDED